MPADTPNPYFANVNPPALRRTMPAPGSLDLLTWLVKQHPELAWKLTRLARQRGRRLQTVTVDPFASVIPGSPPPFEDIQSTVSFPPQDIVAPTGVYPPQPRRIPPFGGFPY